MHTAQLKAVTMKLQINILPVSKKRNVGVDVLSIKDLLHNKTQDSVYSISSYKLLPHRR